MTRDRSLVQLLMEQLDPEWTGRRRRERYARIDAALRSFYANRRALRIDLFVKDWLRNHPGD